MFSHYKFQLLLQGISWNVAPGEDWNTVAFIRCVIILRIWDFQEALPFKFFPDIETHLHLSPITKGFNSSIKVSVKNFLVVETFFSMPWHCRVEDFLQILFLALDYWPSEVPNNVISDVPPRFWNSSFSVTRGFVFSILVSAKDLNWSRSMDKSKYWFFPRTNFLMVRNIQKWLFFWFISACKVIFESSRRVHFFYQSRNQKIFTPEEY